MALNILECQVYTDNNQFYADLGLTFDYSPTKYCCSKSSKRQLTSIFLLQTLIYAHKQDIIHSRGQLDFLTHQYHSG